MCGASPRPPAARSGRCALQVGSVGEEQAAQYILAEVQKIAAEAAERRPDLVVEAARESVRWRPAGARGARPPACLPAACVVPWALR